MKRPAAPVWFQGATSASILGHTVQVDGPQTPGEGHGHGKKHAEECCILIDGNVIYYEIGPEGVHSHSYMHKNFATPWELAEALIRDYGALAVRGGPSADAPPHPHGGGSSGHDDSGHQHVPATKRRRK